MTILHSKALVSTYIECGDKAILDANYLVAHSAYSTAFGILITIDAPHEFKYVAQTSAELRDKLENAKNLFEDLWKSTLAGA